MVLCPYRDAVNFFALETHLRRGDLDAALRAARRRDYYEMFGLAPVLLETARIHHTRGEIEEAARCYRHYLNLRPDPEAGAAAENVAAARRELASLSRR